MSQVWAEQVWEQDEGEVSPVWSTQEADRPAQETPELTLCFTLMLEAIQRVLVEARRPVRSSAWLEDLRWIYSSEDHYPFSFLCVAAILNLDPKWIRDKIYRALSIGDPLAAPTLAQGLKRCRLAGLVSLDEAKTRRQRQELKPAA